jgi:hypothetical protein
VSGGGVDPVASGSSPSLIAMVPVRRILWLLIVCLATAVAYTAWQRRQSARPLPAEPVWPPFDVDEGHLVPAVVPHVTPATAPEPDPEPDPPGAPTAATWVPPVDGACPDGYPIKAKQSSRIYHVPGGRFYDRTTPDRCYADPAAADADGYRASKS